MLGLVRRMLVGIEFTENSSERIALAVLRGPWNACVVAGVPAGCGQRLCQSSTHIYVETNHALIHTESLSVGNFVRRCDHSWR